MAEGLSPDKQVMNLQQISDRESLQKGATRLSDPSHIKIWYNAEVAPPSSCCACIECITCIGLDRERSYIYLREGSLETNKVDNCKVCECLFPQVFDHASVRYFDRSPWMAKSACMGCCSIKPSIEKVKSGWMCCCKECDPCPACCGGDYMTFSPVDKVCCCVPNKINGCCNYCGLFGPISGEPWLHIPYFIQPKDVDGFVAQCKQVIPAAQAMKAR